MAIKKLTEVDITNTVLDNDTILVIRGNLVQRINKADLTRGFIGADELAVERSRIDNLLKLQEGSTTGDAELQDLRVGVDGTAYDSAGTAIRTQIQDLSSQIDQGSLNLSELTLSTDKSANKVTLYMSDGKIQKNVDIPMPIDGVLSNDSINPIQNKPVSEAINQLKHKSTPIFNEETGELTIGTGDTTVELSWEAEY